MIPNEVGGLPWKHELQAVSSMISGYVMIHGAFNTPTAFFLISI